MGVFDWLRTSETVALGWTLLHICWQSAVVALVYAIVDRCMIRAAAAVRYGLALCMLALIPLIAFTTFYNQQRLVVHISQGEHPVIASQLGPLHLTVANGLPFATPSMAGSELWIAGHTNILMPWLDALWLAGVCLLTLRALIGWWRLDRLRRHAHIAVPATVQRGFEKVAQQLRLAHSVSLHISDEIFSPLAMGIWRAAVIVPVSAVVSLPPDQLEAVLAHELAHVRRWDYIGNLLQTAIECLFFFHPAVWWMSGRTRDLREMCCDEVAARTCINPGIYAEALLRLEERRTDRLQLAVALNGNGGTLLNRIRRVMGDSTVDYSSISAVRLTAAALVIGGLLVAPHVADGLKAEPAHARILSGNPVAIVPMPVAKPAASPKLAIRNQAAPQSPAPVMARVEERDDAVGSQQTEKSSGDDYIQRMRDAGYPLDLNKDLDTLVSLRALGVTPEYAKGIAQAGFGTPTLRELISLKAQNITPEYIASLKGTDAAPSNLHELISEKALGITSEYAKSVASFGLGTPTNHDLISLKALGVTPEYFAELKASGITPSNLHELSSLRALNVTAEYAKSMSSAGYPNLSSHELMSLKAQGVTPEYIHWVKTTFPNSDLHQVQQAAVFHINADFIASAKAHGFNSSDLEKLIRLRMTGLLN